MSHALIILIGAQLLFTTGDLLARAYMPKHGFTLTAFVSVWFAVYILIRTFATFGQLYVFTQIELGKTIALFGAISIILANGLGLLVLKEAISPMTYVGVSLAVLAFIILAFN